MATKKALRPDAINTQSLAPQKFQSYYVDVNEDVEYEDLFDPSFWIHNRNFRPLDVVRVRRADGQFDVDLTVNALIAGGVVMEWRGGRPPAGVDPYKVQNAAMADYMQQKIAPIENGKPMIRAEFTPKTKWRVIGLGNEEIRRDIQTKDEAERVLAGYLLQVNMRNPTEVELKEHLQAKIDKKTIEAQGTAAGQQQASA